MSARTGGRCGYYLVQRRLILYNHADVICGLVIGCLTTDTRPTVTPITPRIHVEMMLSNMTDCARISKQIPFKAIVVLATGPVAKAVRAPPLSRKRCGMQHTAQSSPSVTIGTGLINHRFLNEIIGRSPASFQANHRRPPAGRKSRCASHPHDLTPRQSPSVYRHSPR